MIHLSHAPGCPAAAWVSSALTEAGLDWSSAPETAASARLVILFVQARWPVSPHADAVLAMLDDPHRAPPLLPVHTAGRWEVVAPDTLARAHPIDLTTQDPAELRALVEVARRHA